MVCDHAAHCGQRREEGIVGQRLCEGSARWRRRRCQCRRRWRRRDRCGEWRGRGNRCRRRCGGSLLSLLDIAQHVLLADAPASAGAADLAQIDAVLGGETGNNRRDRRTVSAAGTRWLWSIRRHRRCRRPGACFWSVAHCRFTRLADPGKQGADRHGGAFWRSDFKQDATGDRCHLGRDLIRFDFHERFVSFDAVADALEPAPDRRFGHAFADLRQNNINRHGCIPGVHKCG